MKLLISILIFFCFLEANELSNKITNDTNTDMLCVGTYPSVYEDQVVEGKKRRVKVLENEEIIETIKVNQTLKKKREGKLACYNEYKEVISVIDNRIFQTNKRTLESYLTRQNSFDLSFYENKTRNDIDRTLFIAQRCAPYKEGKYCNYAFGLDILFDKNEKVKTIFLYDTTVNKGKLPFEAKSIFKLYYNSRPLGLWVVKKYKKLFSKKPTISRKNLIEWENLSKHIKRVSMTPENGYFKLSYRLKDGRTFYKDAYRNDSEIPRDYIGSIQVEYR